MSWKTEWKKLALVVAAFVACFYLPTGSERFRSALAESLLLVRWYAREHVLLCLVPAFFIAGAIAVFIGQASVIKYLGARANKLLAYGVSLLVFYGLGHCSVIVLAGSSTRGVQRYLNWSEQSKGAIVVQRVCGLLILLGGVYLIYIA